MENVTIYKLDTFHKFRMMRPLAKHKLNNSELISVDNIARQLFISAGYTGEVFRATTELGYDHPEYNSCYILLPSHHRDISEDEAKKLVKESLFVLLYYGRDEFDASPSELTVAIYNKN